MSFIRNISLRPFVNAVYSLAALTGLLVSCVQIEDEKNTGYGYLSFSPISIDYSVENLVSTKAKVPAEDLPTADDFTITISASTLQNPIVILPGQQPEGSLSLPVGSYTVSVAYGSNEFNQPFFYAEQSVDLEMDETEEISLENIPLENAMVAVTMPADMADHMDVESISLSDGVNSIDVEPGRYYYVPSDKSVTVSFSGTNMGERKTISVSLGVMQPQHAYDVVCSLDLPVLTFDDQSSGAIAGKLFLTSLASGDELDPDLIEYEICYKDGENWTSWMNDKKLVKKNGYWLLSELEESKIYKIRAVYGAITSEPWEFTPSKPTPFTDVTLTHTYNTSNVLTGSAVTTTGTDISCSGVLQGLVKERGVRVKNSEGTIVRILADKEIGTLAVTNDWIYLPTGSYTIESYIKIGDESEIVCQTKALTSHKPEITVKAYAETSYSRYTSTDATLKAKANDAGTGDKVMNIQGKVSISDAILGNPNYSNLIKATLTYDGISMLSDDYSVTSSTLRPNTLVGHTGLFEANNYAVIGQDWGSHKVAASFTFDGVKATHDVPCHVTGIPYNISFQDNIRPAKWTLSNNGSSYSRLVLKRGEAYALTPTFIIPGNIYAEAILQAYAYRGSVGKYSPTVAIHVSNSGVNATADETLSGVSDLPYTATYSDVKSDLNFTTSSKVCIYTSGKGSDWSVGSGDMGVVCQSFTIHYR